jgi:hypothetical protein
MNITIDRSKFWNCKSKKTPGFVLSNIDDAKAQGSTVYQDIIVTRTNFTANNGANEAYIFQDGLGNLANDYKVSHFSMIL